MVKIDDTEKKIDAAFAPFLRKIILEEYHYLLPDNIQEQKRSFFDTGKVDFSYSSIHANNLVIQKNDLKLMIDKVNKSAAPDTLKSLYLKKFAEQELILNLLSASVEKDDVAFSNNSSALYGNPQEGLLWYTIEQNNFRFSTFMEGILATDTVIQSAYSTWLEFKDSQRKPEHETIHHTPFTEGIFVPYDDEVDSAEKIYQLFVKFLNKKKIQNWSVEIDSPGKRTAFGVNQANKVITIPHDSDLMLRKDSLTKKSLKALLEHEIGVHVVRRENGEDSQLEILGIGLDNYLRAEEGLAMLAEQLITGNKFSAGNAGYLATGAAQGILGEKLDFRKLYDMLYAYFVLDIAEIQIDEDGFYDIEEVQLMASEKAWSRALRTFRGSTGSTPGTIYTRDIIYLEGNRNIWELVGDEPAIKPEWLVGKYDPTNNEHVSALKEFEILS